ncbi:MAG TPA: hypothetical protein PLI21_05480 [Methanomassiliicoccaceae archaeon]|nr:hypothetical protein [Methanomassiliicoccaceae archaeon]
MHLALSPFKPSPTGPGLANVVVKHLSTFKEGPGVHAPTFLYLDESGRSILVPLANDTSRTDLFDHRCIGPNMASDKDVQRH